MCAEKHGNGEGKECSKERSIAAWKRPAVDLNVPPMPSRAKIKQQYLDFQCNLIWQAPQKQ